MLARAQTSCSSASRGPIRSCSSPTRPLILAFTSGFLAHNSHGREHAYAQAVSYPAMAIWASLELLHGVNSFRWLLGLAYTISTAVHLANSLRHY